MLLAYLTFVCGCVPLQLVETGSGIREGADALNEALARKAEVTAARGVLELLLDTGNVLSKVEKLIQELDMHQKKDGSSANNMAAVEAQSQLLERIASEVSRLDTYSSRGKGLPLVEGMRPRIETAQNTLTTALEKCFSLGMSHKNVRVVKHCLHAYAALDDAARGEKALREILVSPLVSAAMESPAGSAEINGWKDLESIYGALQESIRTELTW